MEFWKRKQTLRFIERKLRKKAKKYKKILDYLKANNK